MSEWKTGIYSKGFSDSVPSWVGRSKRKTPRATEVWTASWWSTDPSGTTNANKVEDYGDVNYYEYVKPMIALADCASDGGYENSTASEFINGENGCPTRFPAITEKMMAMPEGRRSLRLTRYDNGPIYQEVADRYPNGDQSPWAEVAGLTVKNDLIELITALKQDGCFPDYVIGDLPPGEYNIFNFFDSGVGGDTNMINNITTDPKANEIWYQSPKSFNNFYTFDGTYGLTFGEIFADVFHPQTNRQYLRWNGAVTAIQNELLNEFIYRPMLANWRNDIKFSNFDSFVADEETQIYDINGHPGVSPTYVGDATAPILYATWNGSAVYGVMNTDNTRLVRTDWGASNGGTTGFSNTAWNQFLLLIQKVRGVKRKTPSVPMRPWIPSVDWGNDNIFSPRWNADGATGLYWECVRHAILTGSEMLNYWNYGDIENNSRAHNQGKMDNIMREINQRTGGFIMHEINTSRISFLSEYVISGSPSVYGGYHWRVTPKSGVSLEYEGNGLTFDNDGGRWITTTTSEVPSITVV